MDLIKVNRSYTRRKQNNEIVAVTSGKRILTVAFPRCIPYQAKEENDIPLSDQKDVFSVYSGAHNLLFSKLLEFLFV